MIANRLIKQAGMSLIEVMIALALGSLLLLGLVQVFSASKAAYMSSEGLSRVQESSRFAMDFLQRDLRQAGLMGCGNDLSRNVIFRSSGIAGLFSHFATDGNPRSLTTAPAMARFDVPLEGYEATGTDWAASLDRSSTTNPPLATAATDWSPALPAAVYAAIRDRVIAGSDIIAVRMAGFDSVPAELIKGAAPAVHLFNAAVTKPSNFLNGHGLYMISDCKKSSFLQVTGPLVAATARAPVAIGTGLNQAGFDSSEEYSGGSSLYRLESYVYFVGLADHDGDGVNETPSLFRLNLQLSGAGAAVLTPEELVEGVENMQIRYNWDGGAAAAVPAPDGIPESINNASGVVSGAASVEDRWRAVGAVRVGLLVRSENRAVTVERNSAAPDVSNTALGAAYSVNGLRYTPPNDERMRQVYETTVTLRNRLNGN